ncbi:uncharacterized protein A4U43_C01F22770 [Asparagus officinalis]|uniref:Uncharacterized protein n=1 Tax=Asparagus officinalis TaxID=4686 RepID=A0A5P1FRM8_ASPOF|nr:polynucleotide 5'-hydroxyl-kinase NOL9 [Asparagus officinalis]XP_020250367.1 polynucleotide 5'-hydroxyl-kinase NOL9 [Asparagus officinalis]ONK80878.1 uncharacterized protein A4U43_C01F22770 [Asparagus officinalis]
MSYSSSREVILPPQWSEAVITIASSFPPPPITLICGPKNSGKSTFSRFLLNSLLQRYKRVGYLDTDVGQPEFTAPGCLSLHVIDDCLSDFTNPCIKAPEKCFFFGDTSSKRDPNAYLDCTFSLYDCFLKEFYQLKRNGSRKSMSPLIINTPGWVKGTGFDVLVKMLRYIFPTHVVQLRISAESKNLPTGIFWLDQHEHKEPINLFEIHSAQRDFLDRSVLVPKDARVMQEHRLFEYFKQCFPSSYNIETNKELACALASLPPYEVAISRIKVKHLHYEVPKSEIFHSLNATIVGLAASSLEPRMNGSCTPWCFGLGIVRGVDVRRDLLYVITPVPCQSLEKIDLLLLGYIEIPIGFLQAGGLVSPYMSTNVMHKLSAKDL